MSRDPQPRPTAADLEKERVHQELRARMFGAEQQPLQIDRFTLTRKLGAGAMGIVYEGFDPRLGREVAVKVMAHAKLVDPTHFHHEARALARLSHPFVLQVYEAGVHEGMPFLVCELVRGGTLRTWLSAAGATRSTKEILGVLLDTARGLHAAHQRGLVHRDVKPENVLVGVDGRPRLCDFGLASVPDPTALYKAGEARLAGTLRYMSPEQLRGESADPLSDQFSFCLMAAEALFGRIPFDGQTPEEWLTAITAGRIVEPPAGRAARALWPALRRGLQALPLGRYPSMADLSAALEHAAGGARRRWMWVGGVSLAVAVTVVVGVALTKPSVSAPGAFKSEAESTAYQKAAALLIQGDPRGCAQALAPFPKSEYLVRLRADCAFKARDAKLLTAVCTARERDRVGGEPPDPCDAATQQAVAHFEARRYRECVDTIERSKTTPSHSLILVECVTKWGSPEAYQRQCLWFHRDSPGTAGECRNIQYK